MVIWKCKIEMPPQLIYVREHREGNVPGAIFGSRWCLKWPVEFGTLLTCVVCISPPSTLPSPINWAWGVFSQLYCVSVCALYMHAVTPVENNCVYTHQCLVKGITQKYADRCLTEVVFITFIATRVWFRCPYLLSLCFQCHWTPMGSMMWPYWKMSHGPPKAKLDKGQFGILFSVTFMSYSG